MSFSDKSGKRRERQINVPPPGLEADTEMPAKVRMPGSDPFVKRLTSVIMAHGLALAAHGQATNSVSNTGTNAPAKLPDVVVQGEQGKAPDPFKPEKVQSPKYTQPLRDIPQTVTVVPRAIIEQQNATTLRDVLRNVPGIRSPTSRISKPLNRYSFSLTQSVVSGPASVSLSRPALHMPSPTISRSK